MKDMIRRITTKNLERHFGHKAHSLVSERKIIENLPHISDNAYNPLFPSIFGILYYLDGGIPQIRMYRD
jgi:hypothetical protein